MEKTFWECLEQVLGYATRRPREACYAIRQRYTDVFSLAAADIDELGYIPDVGAIGANLIKLAFTVYSRRITDKFRFGKRHTESEIREYFKALFLPLPNETIYLMLVDADEKIIGCNFITEGTVNSLDVTPRKLLEVAVRNNARSVILAHNHPSGNAKPSIEDIETTKFISELFAASNRRLIAHYVVSGNDTSCVEVG